MSTQTPSDNTIAGIQKWLSVRIAVTVSFVSLRWDPGLIHQEYIRGEIGLGAPPLASKDLRASSPGASGKNSGQNYAGRFRYELVGAMGFESMTSTVGKLEHHKNQIVSENVGECSGMRGQRFRDPRVVRVPEVSL